MQPAPCIWLELRVEGTSLARSFGFAQPPPVKQTTITAWFPIDTGIEEGGEGTGKDDLICKTLGFSPPLLFLTGPAVFLPCTPPMFVLTLFSGQKFVNFFLLWHRNWEKESEGTFLSEYQVIRWKVVNNSVQDNSISEYVLATGLVGSNCQSEIVFWHLRNLGTKQLKQVVCTKFCKTGKKEETEAQERDLKQKRMVLRFF